MTECNMLSARFGRSDGHLRSVYESEGGYTALRKVLGSMKPVFLFEVLEECVRF